MTGGADFSGENLFDKIGLRLSKLDADHIAAALILVAHVSDLAAGQVITRPEGKGKAQLHGRSDFAGYAALKEHTGGADVGT